MSSIHFFTLPFKHSHYHIFIFNNNYKEFICMVIYIDYPYLFSQMNTLTLPELLPLVKAVYKYTYVCMYALNSSNNNIKEQKK